MQFYSILISILRWFLPKKYVPLGQMVKGGSKNPDLFTVIQWHLLYVLLINAGIIFYSALSENMVSLIEAWDKFVRIHHFLQVTAADS